MASKLTIFNDFSFLQTNNLDLKSKLYHALRHRDRNYFHSAAYKSHRWDGFINFFTIETGKFMTGLLPEVMLALKRKEEEYEIDDKRIDVTFAYDEIKPDFLNQWNPPTPIVLEDYQCELTEAAMRYRRGVIFAPTSAGKAQPLDSLVATPSGFKKMGDICVGDNVLVPSGGYAPVTGVFPQGKKKILRLVFSNGSSVECCEDHLWKVNATYDQWKDKIITAKEIRQRMKCPNVSNRFNISPPERVDFAAREVDIDPYFMGLLLGDGSFRVPTVVGFSNIDDDIIESVIGFLKEPYKLVRKKNSRCDYSISSGKRGKGTPTNAYWKTLQKYELDGLYSHEKFVPDDYLINTAEARLSLLQGLMDTDGTVGGRGNISFCSTSEKLATAVMWLVHSLGGVAYRSERVTQYTHNGEKRSGKKSYIVHMTLPQGVCPFRLDRKAIRCKKIRIKNRNRTICDVQDAGEKECQCIMVDHPDHLYITDDFVVTHNTMVMVCIIRAIKEGIPTLILQNRRGLAQQNYDELIRLGVKNVGTCWGGAIKPNIITVATVQSLAKIKKLLPYFKVLLVDEIHDMMSTQPKAVYKVMKNASVRIAMSATPFKYGGSDKVQKYMVKGFFGPTLEIECAREDGGILTTKGLQKRGRLSKSHCTFFPVREPNLEYELFMDAYTFGVAENQDFHQMVKRLALAQKGRTLILVERLAHGDALHAMLPGSIWVRGEDTDTIRKAAINQLQTHEGECIAIATHGIFNTGVNVFVHNLVNAAGGQAEHQIIQRMGRGLRTAKDKTILQYYDFIFYNSEYLLKHSKKRIKILTKEGHQVEMKDFDL